jgi:hypothetical protein
VAGAGGNRDDSQTRDFPNVVLRRLSMTAIYARTFAA